MYNCRTVQTLIKQICSRKPLLIETAMHVLVAAYIGATNATPGNVTISEYGPTYGIVYLSTTFGRYFFQVFK